MANSNIIIKNFNGTTYDELYPKTLAEQVFESSLKKFVTQAQIDFWNGLSYTHPSTHPASIIVESTTKRFVTDAEKVEWNGKAPQTTTYSKTEVDNLISSIVSNLDWKEAVNTFTDLATTYPSPQEGWTTSVKDVDKIYRYSGTAWIDIFNGISMALATGSINGLMSKEDFTKLAGVKVGANVTAKSTTNGNVLIDGVQTIVYTHPTGTNPHSTTKADVGLGSVDNTSDASKPVSTAQATALGLKVDKVAGKQLSTEDFTLAYKNKLIGLNRTVTSSIEPVGSALGDIWYQTI